MTTLHQADAAINRGNSGGPHVQQRRRSDCVETQPFHGHLMAGPWGHRTFLCLPILVASHRAGDLSDDGEDHPWLAWRAESSPMTAEGLWQGVGL